MLAWSYNGRHTLKEDTAYRHSKALGTHIHYTVLQVLKEILTSWAHFRSGKSSSNSTSEQNPCFNSDLCGFFAWFCCFILNNNELQKKQICSWKWEITTFYAGTDIAIGNSYYNVFAQLRYYIIWDFFFHSKLFWTCQVYHISGGDLNMNTNKYYGAMQRSNWSCGLINISVRMEAA